MEEVLSQTSEAVTDKISTFSRSAGEEGQRASDALKDTQRALVSEMENALQQATQRFNDTADAMRQTASQMGEELEATRNELQRGVLELPEETRASAAAMRRVVAEQIEALAELNSIVRAQPASHGLSGRQPEPPQRPAPRPIAERPAPPQPAPPQPAAPQTAVPAQAAEPEPETAVKDSLGAGFGATRTLEPAQAEAPAEQPDWLRNMRGASQPALETSHSPEPARAITLSNLTEEIARSIDSGALADAWARYQSGDANVFSRRIYTLTGQGTYDEVRRKMQRDPEFASTAAAYIEEFEQLLRNSAYGSNPVEETRTHLLSDQGKVYTMLAHASGRLS
jgi:hypothetical protein